MSGNEILINLNAAENLGQQELMAGLLELAKRDKRSLHDWNANPIAQKCIEIYTQKLPGYNAKRVLQGALMLSKLRIRNREAWIQTSKRILFLRNRVHGVSSHLIET